MSVGLVKEAEVCAGSTGSLLMVSEIAESVRAMRVQWKNELVRYRLKGSR